MKKKICLVGMFVLVVGLTITGCGETKTRKNNPIKVEVEKENGSSKTKDEVKEENNKEDSKEKEDSREEEVKDKEDSNNKNNTSSDLSGYPIGTGAYYVSGREPFSEIYGVEVPAGIAAEFTYFFKDDIDSMVKAQHYLEKVGVSKDGEKLVVVKTRNSNSASLSFEVRTYGEDGYFTQTHVFCPNEKVLVQSMSDYGNTVEFSDEGACYFCTQKTVFNPNMSFEDMAESAGYKKAYANDRDEMASYSNYYEIVD